MIRLQMPDLTPEATAARLRARPGRAEFAAFIAAAGMLIGFTLLAARDLPAGLDYAVFLRAATGDATGYYYAPWFLPVFEALNTLPFALGYVLWGMFNLIGVGFALRVFDGPRALALISYQMLYVLYYGNIAGVIVGCLALAWWGLQRDRWMLAGAACFIAATKFQLGLPLGLMVWLLASTTWRVRSLTLIVASGGVVASLIIWPDWIPALLQRIGEAPPYAMGNISLWAELGPAALLLLLPPALLRLARGQRMILWTSAVALALPYFQQTDLLGLFVLPVGWLAALGNIGYAMLYFGWDALQWMSVIPALAYAGILIIALPATLRHQKRRPDEAAGQHAVR